LTITNLVNRQLFINFIEQLHKDVNEKVEAGILPQATFNEYDKESKQKKSKEHIHLDRRKPEKTNKG
jgi:hypothetical protein